MNVILILIVCVLLACPPMLGAGHSGHEEKAMSVTESNRLATCVPSEWSGNFHHPQWQFAARMQLLPFTSASDKTVRGQIIWTMERSPKPEEQSKIGLSAIEYVSGEFDSSKKQLTLRGNAISDPHNLHIALDSYSLSLSEDGQSMEGATTAHTDGLGRISLSRQSSADDPIVIRSELPVSLDTAWKMWTDAASLKTWLCEDATVGSKVGDSFELFWEPEHRDRNSTIGCKINAIDIGKNICFNWKGPVPFADFMNVSPAPTYVVVAFRPVGKDQTLVVLQHGGWGKGPQWDEARKWQEQAWRKAIGCLKSHCN